MIYAEGNNRARTRRYQIGINKFWYEIKEMFNVYGYVGENWERFQKNINYTAFLITRKTKDYLLLQEPTVDYMATPPKNNTSKVIIHRRVATDLPDLSNDPTVLRKTAEAKAFLEKHPIPKEFLRKPR